MAQGDSFTTQRDGDWSRPITYHDSPWWRSDAQDAGSTGFYPADGSTVIVRHDLTVDVDVAIGLSLQAALWSPPDVTATGGVDVTELPTGNYTFGASVVSPNGETQLASSTATVSLTHGVSKPVILFEDFPPSGCTYSVYLDDPSRSGAGRLTLYCSGIGGKTLKLIPDFWGNTWDTGVVSGGGLANQDSASPQTPGAANAITMKAAGSITIAAGKRLTLKGEFVSESVAKSTKPYIIVGAGGTYRCDGSGATDPARARYQMVFQGGGSVRFTG